MNTNIIKEYLDSCEITYEENVKLESKTWIHRGGFCGFFVTPANTIILSNLVRFLIDTGTAYLIVGCTSNIYIKNSFDIDVVISTLKCREITFDEKEFCCECGVLVTRLAKECVNRGICGYEYLTSLPGTVAGGIYNNSSCHENCITDNLKEVKVLTDQGELISIPKADLDLTFRNSVFKKKSIKGCILNVTFSITNGDIDTLKQIAYKNEANRRKILESPSKNLGCTVNRPFILGRKPIWMRFVQLFCRVLFRPFMSIERYDMFYHNILFTITGQNELGKYVSPKNILTFIWRDEGADRQFDNYLSFMKKYFKTDSVEIEIFG